MRQKSVFLILLATFLLAIIPLEGFAYKTQLYGLYGNYTQSVDGVYTINRNGWNNLVLSQIQATAFTYEANVKVLDGDRMSLIFGYTGSAWYGIELSMRAGNEVGIKGFRDGPDGSLFFDEGGIFLDKSKPVPFKIDVSADGTLIVLVNDIMVKQMMIDNYRPGYLGLLTFQSQVELSNVEVDVKGEEGRRVNLEGLSGNYSMTQPVYTINHGNGDNFVLIPTEAQALSIEGKVEILDGDRMSFVFGYKHGGDWCASELRKVNDGRVAIKAFHVGGIGDLFNEEFDVDAVHPITYKIDIAADGTLTVFLNGQQVKQAKFPDYSGGRWGMLTWNTQARVSDLVVDVKNGASFDLNYLCGENNAYFKSDVSYIINRSNGNNMVSSTVAAEAFSYSGKIQILDGDRMSFVFGSGGSLGGTWFGTELRKVNDSSVAIKTFREGNNALFDEVFNVDATQPVLFKIDVTAQGLLTVYLNGVQVKQATFPTYQPGRLGMLTWNSQAKVSDVLIIVKDQAVENGFKTNTTGWAQDPNTTGYWRITPDGLRGSGSGNSPYFSSSSASNFIIESDMNYLGGVKSGGLLFRANADHSVYYTIDLMNDDRQGVRILKFYKNKDTGAMSDITLGGANDNLKTMPGYIRKDNFKVRVEAIQSSINVYIDNNLVVTASDDESLEGFFGVTNYSSETVFQNMYYTELTDLPLLTSLTCDAELSPAYSTKAFKYNAIVPFETTTVTITPATVATNDLFINDQAVTSEQTTKIALEEGMNVIRIKVQDKVSKASTITELNIKRRQNPATAYTERYRPQFHYTPEANWINDPNGMVYFEGEYHFFYQYYPYSKQQGPKHWGHAISTDMVHWVEYPIALYPDKFGDIWSGSAVVDVNNTTGFFTDVPGQKGLVAIYTSAGAAQQQCIAYSTDKGRTWIKYNGGEPVLKTADDPFNNRDFRDPKVFWLPESNRWMMVVAGGPLRFYSSANLKEWTFESGYSADQTIDGKLVKSIYTECPDFFKLPVEGGSGDKWVLTKAGKEYLIGDFKMIGDKWYFIPDANTAIGMNFGPDYYAAQTYSDMPDGRRVMVNWMINFAYIDNLANVTDPYNGTFTMAYELNLKQTASGIKLYQTPIKEYEELRKTPYSFRDITVTATSENILKDIQSNQFEIVAEFTPEAGNTQFGFNLRTGNNQVTKVYYNTATQRIVIDRTKSGTNPNASFINAYGQSVNLKDGKLKLHIFVDWSSIEVFVNDGEAVGTSLIFPDTESTGMELFSKGSGAVNCNVDVYPLKSIWREEIETHIINPKKKGNPDFDAIVYSSNNVLTIEPVNSKELKYELFTMEGKLAVSGSLSGTRANIPLHQGVYVLKLSNKEIVCTKKVIIG